MYVMKHLKAIGIKFVIISVVLYSLLAIFETASLTEILTISISVTILSYVLGDLFILPRYNNVIATIADFGLVFAIVWILASMFIYSETPIGIVSGFSAFFIAVSETLFHVYMKEKVLDTVSEDHNVYKLRPARLQTEIAEDNDVNDFKRKHEKRD